MEIHTPKAFRGWRGFLKEYGTIVIGVLTALGAEQAVEAYHHREQVRQGEEALKANYFVVLRNVANLKHTGACLGDRLREIRTILDQAAVTHRLPRIGAIPTAIPHRWEVSVWDAMVASQAAAHLPADKAFLYAGIAHSAHQLQLTNFAENEAWAPLAALSGPARPFSEAEEASLRAALARAENESYILRGIADGVQERIVKTGLIDQKTLDEAQRVNLDPRDRMCEPITVQQE